MSFNYRGLEAEYTRHIVEDEEVDRQMERLRQQGRRVVKIEDRPAQKGDELLLDYAGYCDGVQFEGGTAENQTLVLGSGTFIPGFEDQLLGSLPGSRVTVHVTFPEKYHAPALAGKEAEFRCTVHEIRETGAYELDDVFAREVGQCETLEEMREKLRESLQTYSDERGEWDLRDRLLRKAAATLDFSASEAEIEAAVDQQMETMKAQLSQQGLTLEMYCRFMDSSEEKLREDARPEAEQDLRMQAAVREIAKREGLAAEEKEIAEACAAICRQNHITMEQLRPHYDEAFEEMVIRGVLTRKAMELVRKEARVTEKKET